MLKPYIAYSRSAGPHEGCILVIAHSVREAKKLAWGHCWNVDDWTDQAINLIKDESVIWLSNLGKLAADIPHIIESPECCEVCQSWGVGLTEDNLCKHCNEYPGDRLIALLSQEKKVTLGSE